MEYIIISLLVIIIILIIILLCKGNSSIIEKLGSLETNNVRELSNFKSDLVKSLTEDFNNLNDRMEKRLILINEKVNERLDENFNKTKIIEIAIFLPILRIIIEIINYRVF